MHHKGYFLLKKALTEGFYDNIEVIVVDHSLPAETSRQERWGGSKVTVIGRIDQDKVGWLYGRFSVLAAPSLWPESYGLVTREALAYGRWVIASDLGAVAEDVVPGKNGWMISVSDVRQLQGVLQLLQADPDRYGRSPPSQKLRTSANSATDVAEMWSGVITRTV